ncbi:MAG: hypothetical protein OQK77_12560, partial [Psychromonas sp.]|nr:hypothetical protein [Psychromonas sp.]
MRPLRFSTVILSLVLVLLAIASAILLTAAYQGAEKAITHEVRQGYKRDQRSLDGLMQAQFKNIQQISLELTKRNELKEGLIIKDELRIRHIIEHFLADGSGRYIDAIVITDDKDGSRIISSNISLLGLQIPLKQISQRYTPLGVWTSIVTEVNDKHYSLLQLSLPIIYGQFGEIIGTLHTFVLLNNNYWISNQLQGIFGSDAISLNDGDLILDELESQPGQLQILRSIDRSINKGVIITKRNILRVHNLRIGKSDNYRVWSLLS